MRRIICWVAGHRWNILKVHTAKAVALCHLHPMAGMLAECKRCRAVWDDLPSGRIDELAGWTKTASPSAS